MLGPPPSADAALSTPRVLVINDDDTARYVMVRTLVGAGFAVSEAPTGLEGLALALALPDVVVLDVNLPDVSGFEVCRRLREDARTQGIAVLQTSASRVSADHRVQGLNLGADGYLAQPFEPIELTATVRALHRMKSAEQAARRDAAALAVADQRKDEFLATLAHELRNPLAAITTAVGILERARGKESTEVRMRAIIQRQTQHLARLMDDLLDVSRITRGHIDLRRGRIDLTRLLHNVVQTVGPRLAGRNLALEVTGPGLPLELDADVTRLEQVFTNLIENAVKFSDQGGRIDVVLRRHEDGKLGEVSIRDTGVGIAPEALERIFDLFTQADPVNDRARGGLGIGLTLVRSLVAMHGGTVTASSLGVGHGSEFTVRLPLLIAREVPALDPSQTARPGPASGARRRVLLVEDCSDSRQALADLLTLWGHHVRAAPDGFTGVERALADPPELALVDLGLPGMDGFQVAARLRQKLGPRVKLVALTGHAGLEQQERAAASGFDAYRVKPVQAADLEELLEKLSADLTAEGLGAPV